MSCLQNEDNPLQSCPNKTSLVFYFLSQKRASIEAAVLSSFTHTHTHTHTHMDRHTGTHTLYVI